MNRKMASVKIIDSISAIDGADKIECAHVGGWPVVVKAGEYHAGESVVMCEIDSWIPSEIAPFLTRAGHEPKEYLGIKGERLKTAKLRGTLSQGLILPLSVVHMKMFELCGNSMGGVISEGEDVSEVLGIVKWEAPEEAGSNAEKKGNFPSFIRKTDEERVQNLKREIESRRGETFEVTIKLDGCFGFNTLVKTWDGRAIPIGKIVKDKLDVMLIGVDSSGKVVPTKIVNYYNNGQKKKWVDIYFDTPYKANYVGKSGKLRLTPNHKVFTEGMKEISAGELKVGDTIYYNIKKPSASVIHYVRSSLLGDGAVCGKYGKSNAFWESHITKVGYDLFIENALGDCCGRSRQVISGYGSKITQVKSFAYREFDEIRNEWYKVPGKTSLPEDLSWMDNFSVAKWYMDDGSLAHSSVQNDRATFATNGFTKEEVERLANKLRELYAVSVTVYESKGWNIRVNYSEGSINNMWRAISKHIPTCYRYKLPVSFRNIEYEPYPFGREEETFLQVRVLSVNDVEFTKKNFPHGCIGFDLETETHNYFCGGILVHNSSCTVFHNEGVDGVCSRNVDLKDVDGNGFWEIAKKLDLHKKIRSTGRNLAFQGELVAPNIQKNYEGVTKPEWRCFKIWDIDKQEFVLPQNRRELCAELDIPHVPVLDSAFLLEHTVEELLDMAEGPGMNVPKREGLVFKQNNGQFSMKAVSNSYLLKKG